MYILAGPNGAGKSTVAAQILPEFNTTIFVNADEIQKERQCSQLAAGRQMLAALHALRSSSVTFAFETTLAARSYVAFVNESQANGYFVHLTYIWVRSPSVAISRVADRVREGGHDIPVDTIKRRYWRGLDNLFDYYMGVVDAWTLCDNSDGKLVQIANGDLEHGVEVSQSSIFKAILDAKKRHDI